jgi:hypothetical protein
MIVPHDSTLLGWATAAAYLFAAALALAAGRSRIPQAPSEERIHSLFWKATAALMALLAINKQLDLQTILTDLLRYQARCGGWYAQRRVYQLLFVEALVGLALLAGVLLLRLMRKQPRPVKFATMAVLLTLVFIAVRAASFHHYDVLGSKSLLGLRAHVLFESTCIALIIGAAVAGMRSARQRRNKAAAERESHKLTIYR